MFLTPLSEFHWCCQLYSKSMFYSGIWLYSSQDKAWKGSVCHLSTFKKLRSAWFWLWSGNEPIILWLTTDPLPSIKTINPCCNPLDTHWETWYGHRENDSNSINIEYKSRHKTSSALILRNTLRGALWIWIFKYLTRTQTLMFVLVFEPFMNSEHYLVDTDSYLDSGTSHNLLRFNERKYY